MKLDLDTLSRQSGWEIPSEISIGTGVFLQNKAEVELEFGLESRLKFGLSVVT